MYTHLSYKNKLYYPLQSKMAEQTQITSSLKHIVSCDDFSQPPKKKLKRKADAKLRPSQLVKQIFEENGYSRDELVIAAKAKFIEPTPAMISAYTMDASKAVRENDLDKLKELHAAGVMLTCCNKFGDSLVSIACRRSHTKAVKFLVEKANVPVHFVDDFQRTPLHDACWTSEPNFEVVELLLKIAPEHAVVPDKRGHTPFDYARSNHWGQWTKFLSERRSLFQGKRI
jgi:ankyrin repeat protein